MHAYRWTAGTMALLVVFPFLTACGAGGDVVVPPSDVTLSPSAMSGIHGT